VATLKGLDVELIEDVTLTTADAEEQREAAAVTRAVGAVVRDPVVRSVRRDGDRVGWLVAWAPPGAASSEIFRTQFVIQIAGVRAGAKVKTQPRAARIGTTPVAVLDGDAPALAWFEGDRPVLLVADKGEDVASLAAALRGSIPTSG
jgi:hypothetical protein